MKGLLFVSSVQKELASERRAVAGHARMDPLLNRFLGVFLFEELPPRDRRPDQIYLEKVDEAAVYLGLFGSDYGFEDETGVSPTELEFDRATARAIPCLIFVKGRRGRGSASEDACADRQGRQPIGPPSLRFRDKRSNTSACRAVFGGPNIRV